MNSYQKTCINPTCGHSCEMDHNYCPECGNPFETPSESVGNVGEYENESENEEAEPFKRYVLLQWDPDDCKGGLDDAIGSYDTYIAAYTVARRRPKHRTAILDLDERRAVLDVDCLFGYSPERAYHRHDPASFPMTWAAVIELEEQVFVHTSELDLRRLEGLAAVNIFLAGEISQSDLTTLEFRVAPRAGRVVRLPNDAPPNGRELLAYWLNWMVEGACEYGSSLGVPGADWIRFDVGRQTWLVPRHFASRTLRQAVTKLNKTPSGSRIAWGLGELESFLDILKQSDVVKL